MYGRVCSPLEERINAWTHALGLLASLAALPLLIQFAARRGDGLAVLGMCVFGISLVGAYAASTMYHSVRPGPLKDLWLRVDYAAIYVLIAGTYTPFTLGALRGPWGIGLLIVVWTAALFGIYTKLKVGQRYPYLSTFAYLALGWLAVLIIKPLVDAIGWSGFRWLMAGGLAYSVGVIFFVGGMRSMKFGHCAWHIFVLVGSACHVVAVTAYGILPP
jgi:hemolysin III